VSLLARDTLFAVLASSSGLFFLPLSAASLPSNSPVSQNCPRAPQPLPFFLFFSSCKCLWSPIACSPFLPAFCLFPYCRSSIDDVVFPASMFSAHSLSLRCIPNSRLRRRGGFPYLALPSISIFFPFYHLLIVDFLHLWAAAGFAPLLPLRPDVSQARSLLAVIAWFSGVCSWFFLSSWALSAAPARFRLRRSSSSVVHRVNRGCLCFLLSPPYFPSARRYGRLPRIY